jgi:arabinoxylan arabinofuranohydrolase
MEIIYKKINFNASRCRVAVLAIALGVLSALPSVAQQRPVVQTKFTADPAPLVEGDTVYLFTSHDADDAPAGNAAFRMRDWLLYTSTDMVNWQERGTVADLTAFGWLRSDEQKNGAWAIQVVKRHGRYFLYAPIHMHGIGVLTSTSLYGPWTDPIGKPLVGSNFDSIDPTVLIDDDGQAYLYWGNPNLWHARLNDDMVSLAEEPQKDRVICRDSLARKFDYQEGPWVFKRGGKYYMAYASTCCPEGIGWAWSDKPFDHWQYGGTIMNHDGRSNGNHPGIINYKGKDYCFGFDYYLNYKLDSLQHERRSVCLTELHFNADGSIIQCPYWEEGKPVEPTATFDPFRKVEAETMAWSQGLKTRYELAGVEHPLACQHPRIVLSDIDEGDYLMLRNVDFGSRPAKQLSACLRGNAGSVEFRVDSLDGPLLAQVGVKEGKGDGYRTLKNKVKARVTGTHDLYLVFHGKGFTLDWWQLKR